MEGENVDPIPEIGAELAIPDHGPQVAMGSGDEAHIDAQGLLSADPLETAVLEDAQQPHLDGRRQFADLVQEEGAAVGALEPTQASGPGAGETALFMAEEFRVHQIRRDGAAVDAQEGALGPGGAAMDGAGDDLFS